VFRILLKLLDDLDDGHCLDVISWCFNITISQHKEQMN